MDVLPPSGDARRMALYGLRNAIGRFDHEIDKMDANGVSVSATEAVMWACALDGQWRAAGGGYRSDRDSHDDGKLLLGLSWARNRGVHDLLHVVEWEEREGVTFPLEFPADFRRRWSITWARKLGERPAKALLFDAYHARLAGTEVRSSLEAALRWFTSSGD